MTAFDLYIYSIGALAIIASIWMRWPKARKHSDQEPSLASHFKK